MGTLQAYASYLSKRDDVTLSGLATASTNETVEVVLGGTVVTSTTDACPEGITRQTLFDGAGDLARVRSALCDQALGHRRPGDADGAQLWAHSFGGPVAPNGFSSDRAAAPRTRDALHPADRLIRADQTRATRKSRSTVPNRESTYRVRVIGARIGPGALVAGKSLREIGFA